MKPLCLCWLCFALSVLCGCKTTSVTSQDARATMDPNSRIYIALPVDGSYGARPYKGSGAHLANVLRGAFSQHAEVVVGEPATSTEKLLEGAKAKAAEYAVMASIDQWEDRATEWSGKPDRIELSITILRVTDGTRVQTARITGKSSWFTLGGDHPQDLLREPVEKFAKGLYGLVNGRDRRTNERKEN